MQSLLGIKHHTTHILLFLFHSRRLIIIILIILLELREFIRNQQILSLAFMHDEELIPLGSCVIETPSPNIPANVGQLLCELDDL
jgi:hypothetical protein